MHFVGQLGGLPKGKEPNVIRFPNHLERNNYDF